MINDNYLIGMANLAGNLPYSIPAYLAVGSTTGVLTSGDLVTSGEFDRNACSSPVVSTNVVKYIGSRTSVEAGNEYINVVGFHNSSVPFSSGNLQVNFLVPSLLHASTFDIEIEAWISFNRGT